MKSYLQFRVGEQRYAIAVNHIVEVLHLVEITPVPEQPDEQLGVLTLRGRVIPVVDLRCRYLGQKGKLTLTTPLIAVQASASTVVFVVDEVEDVVQFSGILESYPKPSIDSIVRHNEDMVMIPNVEILCTTIT